MKNTSGVIALAVAGFTIFLTTGIGEAVCHKSVGIPLKTTCTNPFKAPKTTLSTKMLKRPLRMSTQQKEVFTSTRRAPKPRSSKQAGGANSTGLTMKK